MADLKIKDAPQAATANATDRLPVSQGTGDAVTVTVAQINTVHEAKLDPHTQYLLESDAAAAYEPKNANIQGHISNTSNPHGVTASQVGAEPANVNIQQHIASTSDPHDTQFDQLGGTLTKLPLNTSLAAQTLTAGEMAWNPDERCFDMGVNGVTLQAGQEQIVNVRNSTASQIANGTVCMATGTIGASGRITIAPMDGTNPANAMYLLGIATEDIEAGADGFVTVFGKVRHVNTSAYANGDVLYTSTTTPGALTKTAPTSGIKQPIAFVVNAASNGVLFVRIETLNHLSFEPANTNIQQHISNTSNPHNVTYAQVGAEPANANIQQHISSTSNPHSVTATQVGLGNVLNATQEVISAKGQALGYCPLDGGAKVSETYLPDSVLGQVDYQGTWNATTNTPTIPAADSTNKGHYYIVAVSGTTNVDGVTDWTIGDWIISNGVTWNKVDNTDSVSSVFGRAGAIVANAGDYNASQITNTPAGNIAAVTVQAAINELDTEKADATATTTALAGKENFHGIESYGTISFNNGTQTLSVASITYWYKGSKFTSATPITAQITSPVADNLYFIYFTDLTGVLTVSTTPWTLKEHVLLATVNWNGSVGAVVRETHNHTRDIDWHYNAHNTIGARYQSGLALVYPSTAVDNQINISSGTIWDEDIRTDIGNETEARLWYKTATSYTFDSTPTTLPYKWNAGTSRVQYLDTDTNTLTDLATNQYTVVWAYATPDIDVPIWILVGEHATPYGTAAAARAATPPSLSTSPVTPESKLIYRWIFQGNGDFIESSDYRQSSSLPAGGTASTSAASVTFTPTGNISSSNVQGAVEELDIEKEAVGVAAGLISTHNSTYDHTKLHDPVTVADSTSIDLTLTGQQISASAIFGTTLGTVCQGNDSRLSDARTPTSHSTGSHSDWPAAVSMTEVGYLDGVTSAIQTQLDNKQPLDATLTALAGVTTAADKLIYATGSDTFTTATLTSAARNLLDDTTTAAMLTTLGAAADNAVVKLTGDQTVAGIKTLTSKTNLSGGALLPNAEALDLAANNRPSIRPSLLLDFANSKTLDPRITYTRASTATYYDGKTFAKAEENLLLYSQEFDYTVWVKYNTTVTANATTAPDGTATADSLLATAGNTYHFIGQDKTLVVAQLHGGSVYLKKNTNQYIALIFRSPNGSSSWAAVVVDLNAGTITQTSYGVGVSNVTSSIQSIADGWYRVGIYCTNTRFDMSLAISFVDSGTPTIGNYGVYIYAAAGTESVYLWGAQLEQRSSVTAYTPTTTQPITNYIPQLMTAASGVPRFDHNPITGESLGLLIEESRANLLLYSNDLTNAAWVKTNLTATKDRISQDGTINACTLTATAANATILQSVTSASAARSTFARVRRITGSGTIEMTQDGGTTWTAISITTAWANYGPASATVTNPSVGFRIATSGDVIAVDGVQLESGAFPTSYIKTEAAQVTRAADAASMTGTNFSSWYRQDQGTLYGEGMWLGGSDKGAYQRYMATLYQSSLNYIAIYNYGGAAGAYIYANGAAQVAINGITNTNQNIKTIFAFALNDCATSRNGGQVGLDSTAIIPTTNSLRIGDGLLNQSLSGTIRKIAYYPARLTNAELQGLTTP